MTNGFRGCRAEDQKVASFRNIIDQVS